MSCFVIMPYGKKRDARGRTTDFDDVYDRIIEKAVLDAGLPCVRCDKIDISGVIHAKMFEQIYHSAVAVVDITSLNANVFYELGVRHALANHVTVLIRRKGTKIPFNIAPMHIIEYDPASSAGVKAAKARIVKFIRNGVEHGKIDSPVHLLLPVKIGEEAKPLKNKQIVRYRISSSPKDTREVRLVTGDIMGVTEADIWVSSENTNMQMSRYLEPSISGNIRWHGAKKSGTNVLEDTIAKALEKAVGANANVPAGAVVPTIAGELKKNGVKRIFHAAAVHGQPGKGFKAIDDVATCIGNALSLADSDEMDTVKPRSILFPLLGTGQGRGDLREKAKDQIEAAIEYLRAHPKSQIKKVYFLNWTERQHNVCKSVMKDLGL